MTLTLRPSIALSFLLVSILSACSPNPTVLQDRVYGSRAVPAPAPAPVQKKPTTAAKVIAPPKVVAAPVAQPGKVITHQPMQIPPPVSVAVEEPTIAPPVVEPVAVATPKAYASSPAVQALIRTADAEAAKGSLDKAADTLERALRMEGDNPDLWMKLAKINEQQGKHDQALGMVSKAQAYREQLN
ncbi:MAG: hypothetical protein BWK73_50390 [Thiothrix lacustris]|uniref:Uncharacterized protein n=1 Tax=Thiothrix lacustris TaxID=525917 RepID=A0A1Y1Q8E2_9GAMM|nr:MAG: hypothetical protein BWK73_50390 [Thiothrix lacustris]